MSGASPFEKEKTVKEKEAQQLLAQTFGRLKGMCIFYLKNDLALISKDTIRVDREYLEQLPETLADILRDLSPDAQIRVKMLTNRLVESVDKIIPNFYVASDYATPNKRDYTYFEQMQMARIQWRIVKALFKI